MPFDAPSSPVDDRADSAPTETLPDADSVEWRGESHPRVRWFVRYAGAGLFGGMLLLVAVTLAFVAASSLRSGGGEYLLLFVVLLLVGGPFSLLYLAAAAGVNGRERLLELVPAAGTLRPRWVALASFPGAAAVVLAGMYPPLLYLYPSVLVCLSVADAAARAEGSLDPTTGTLERRYGDRRREGDVRGLRSVRTHRVGPVAVFRLGYEGRDRLSLVRPRLVVVPDEAADAARAGFEAVRDAEWPGYERYRASRGERIALAAFGVLFVGVGAALAVVIADASAGFAAYAGGVFGLLGLVFLLYARLG